MQPNGGGGYSHDSEASPRYASYDGSGYGSPSSSRATSAQYSSDLMAHSKPTSGHIHVNGHYDDFDFRQSYDERDQVGSQPHTNGINGGHFDDFKFHPDDQVTNHHISLNTKVRTNNHDAIGSHLLYETAMLDTRSYEILDMTEVDELKKEHARLNQRIDAANRKLTLESKVKNAAANLQRLYAHRRNDSRPDTPQSPDSPRKHRNSLLGGRGRPSSGQGAQTLHQAEDELAQSIKKVDELQEQIKSLLDRRQTVERRLLQHTAAVLAEQASKASDQGTNAHINDRRSFDRDELHLPELDEFDGIRDILRGLPAPASKHDLQKAADEHTQRLNDMHVRLEQLNSQLRSIIVESSRSRGMEPEPEPHVEPSPDPKDILEGTFTLLQNTVRALEQERERNKVHYAQVKDSADLTRDAIEEQLETLSTKMHKTMQISSEVDAVRNLRQPPQATGHGYQHQLQYLEESLLALDQLLNQHHQSSGSAAKEMEEMQARSTRTNEYETVLAGLWELMADDGAGGATARGSFDASSAQNLGGDRSPPGSLKKDFSIQAFNSRVQHLFDQANGAKEQQDILRRQIQQQRDLNGKSDMEKDAQIGEIQAKYDTLSATYNATEEELAKYMTSSQQAEREASESRTELMNIMTELEQFKQTIDETQAKQKETDQKHAQISVERNESLQRQAEIQQEMESLESEVVRLTTELTIAKADLEGAYGTRKERQKEAGMAGAEMDALNKLKDQEIEDLKKSQEQQMDTMRREFAERSKLLEVELQDMTNEFQEMTRESLELEKERGQLEGLIDGLRERCDVLESQLNDEKVKWMGIKSPGGGQDPNAPRESTSVMVLRQEFKKMMREARAEGMRLIRSEQEERRKLEAELRKVRQAAGPMGRATAASNAHSRLGSSTTNGVPGTPTLTPASAYTQPAQVAAG